MTFKEKISKEELNELDILHYQGEIVCINNDTDLNKYIKEIKKADILGFDTETKPNFVKGESNKNNVALLQLASNKKVYLIRLNNIKNYKKLFKILSDNKIKKIGLAVKDDIRGLKKLLDFKPANFVDLQEYTKKFDIQDNALKKISGIVLSKRLSKAQRLSNWENEILEEKQQIYAATDAWVCLEIYKKLKSIENNKN